MHNSNIDGFNTHHSKVLIAMVEIEDAIEGGTVKELSDGFMLVDVDGVEIFVRADVNRRACNCCGDSACLRASYNMIPEVRIERHGERDPLDIE